VISLDYGSDSTPPASFLEEDLYRNAAIDQAAAIQQRLLPSDLPAFANVECSAMCRQAEAVGGDFYDLIGLPNGELGIAIGDVSGKGVGAALMMASLHATLRTEVRHSGADLAGLIATANGLFHEASLEHFYSTLFYATFDPASRILRYVNAGHFPPLVVRREPSKIEWLERGGWPLGILPNRAYEVGSITFNPGDVMVAYTDGILEARHASGELWGFERLAQTVMASEDRTAIELNAEILEAVDAFASESKQRDDMALIVLRAR
jgi:phosphoserine phosphatase RsbU/P